MHSIKRNKFILCICLIITILYQVHNTTFENFEYVKLITKLRNFEINHKYNEIICL